MEAEPELTLEEQFFAYVDTQASINSPAIRRRNFEFNPALIKLVSTTKFSGLLSEDPHAHLKSFRKILSIVKYNGVPTEFDARGFRKVTTGVTGLWQPSVHSNVAFLSFDVGSSYHCEVEFTKSWIVHPPIGNVSWV